MKVVKPGLTSRPTLLGAIGAVALLAMAATATFAAGLPNLIPATDPSSNPSQSASATASDRDGASASASATASSEASGKVSEEAGESAGASASADLVAYCNALHGNALQAIGDVVERLQDGKGDKAGSSAVPALPPGLQKVYDRLKACPSVQPAGKPTATPSAKPSEPSESSESSASTPPIVVPGGDRSLPSIPTQSGGHGRGSH
jgi:hypothetical protein